MMDLAVKSAANHEPELTVADFRALFESAPGLFLVVAPEGSTFRMVAVSDAYLQATKKSRGEIVGRSLFEVFSKGGNPVHAVTLQRVRASFERVMATRKTDSMAVQRYDIYEAETDGAASEERYWSIVNSPVLGDRGEIRFLIQRVEDVTALVPLSRPEAGKGMEGEPMRRRGHLSESQRLRRGRQDGEDKPIDGEALCSRAFAEAPVGMVVTTPDGSIVEANQAYRDMLGYVNPISAREGTEYPGAPQPARPGAEWLAGVHPEEHERASERWKKSLDTKEPYETTFRLRSVSDGRWRWHLARALPVLDEDGSIVQWLGACTDIDDRKQAEAKLHRQWHTVNTALTHTPDFSYIFDLDGRFRYVNRALLSFWKKPLEEALGKNFFDLGYPLELAGRLQRQIRQVIESKQPLRDQTPFTGPTGETAYYEYIFVPVLDANGLVEAVAGSTRDVTEQIRTAQQIEYDRRRWRELLLQTPAAIAILHGPAHTFEWVNSEYVRLVGRPADDLVGRTVLEALPEIDGQIYVSLLNKVYVSGENFTGRESLVRLDRGDGLLQDVYVNFIYIATRDGAGKIDGIFVHVTDVTDMVAARKHLEESERQFRTLAETIPHLAWMADETGRIFWYNRRWYDYTGTTLQDMEGWGWQKVHDPEMLPGVLELWRGAILSGEPCEMVFPLKGSDGHFRSFLTRVEPVKDSDGRVVRWFGTNTDITDQRRIEEALRRTNRELEEFAYVASHDLQEPLRMVNIYTHQILKAVGAGDDKLSLYSGFVHQGVARMEALIHDLLTFSRTVHSDELPIGTADLSASLREALSVLKNRIEDAGAVITVESLPSTRGETAQIAHVFQNLLSNALKYRKSETRPEIQVSARPDGDCWAVCVKDNGIGFEAQYAARIFGLFKRLHRESEYPGTGVGLAICKRIVERYGGRIWAESKPNEGATFSFSLPRVEGQ